MGLAVVQVEWLLIRLAIAAFLVLVQELAYASIREAVDFPACTGRWERFRTSLSRLNPVGVLAVPLVLTFVFQTRWVVGVGRNTELWRDWDKMSRSDKLILALYAPFVLLLLSASAWSIAMLLSLFGHPSQHIAFLLGSSAFVQAAFAMLPLYPLTGRAIVRAFDAGPGEPPGIPGRTMWPALTALLLCGVIARLGLDPAMWLLDEVASPIAFSLTTWSVELPVIERPLRWLLP